MNYARIYSWNPFHFNQFAYQGEAALVPPPGGAPSPSTPPAGGSDGTTSPGSSPGEGAASSSQDDFESAFGGFDDNFDSIEIQDATPPTPAEGGAETPLGATPPTPPAAPAAPVAPAAAAPQTPPVATEATPAPSAPLSKREELDQAIDGFKTNFEDLSKWATTEMFALTPAELDGLDTDARSVIPALMAKTYTRSLLASVNFIKNFVPDMIAQEYSRLNGAAKRSSEAESAFYSKWPDLNPNEHGAAMRQWAQLYRQQNPKATREQAIDFVGRALMTQFAITPKAAAAPAVRRPTVPFQPARPGGHVPTPPPEHDPYAGIGEEFDVT